MFLNHFLRSFFLILLSLQFAVAQGEWQTRAPMPTARKEISNAAAVINAKIYVVGGVANNGTITDALEIYDPATNSWSSGAPLPLKVWRASAAAVNGKLYVFGGYQSLGAFPFSPSNRVFEYDPDQNIWTEKTAMPQSRGTSVAVTIAGKIHVLGGANSGPLNLHQVFDPGANSWSDAPPIPTPRSGLTAVAIGDKIYVAGGYILSGGVVAQDVLEVFSITNNTWESRQPLPLPRLGIASAVIRGKMYVFGGTPDTPVSRTLEYDPVTDVWQTLAEMPNPVSFMSVVAVEDSLFVIGGGAVNLNRFDGLEANRLFLTPDVLTAIDTDPRVNHPQKFSLRQNFPNPFNPSTTIAYQLSRASQVVLSIYNIRGQRVRVLQNAFRQPGEHVVEWDGRNDAGQIVTSGVYFYQLQAENFRQRRKMVLLR